MCFNTYLNQSINQKTSTTKNLRANTVLKKEGGGVRRGVIMIRDSMIFLKPSFSGKLAWGGSLDVAVGVGDR